MVEVVIFYDKNNKYNWNFIYMLEFYTKYSLGQQGNSIGKI